MKLSTKIILPIILISALLISLSGCIIPTVTPSPGAGDTTGGTITGTFETPEACCMSNRDHTEGWVPLVNANVSIIDSKGVTHTTKTDSDGKYWLTDVAPGIYYVVTACCECEDREGIYKDVVEEELKEGDTYDAGIADCESTALGLMVDYLLSGDVFVEEDCNCYCNCFDEESQIYASLVTTGVKLRVAAINLLNPATKPLEKIRANADFQGFVVELCDLLEACCVEPGVAPPTGPGPTPDPCAGHTAPDIISLDPLVATAGQEYSGQVIATDVDGDTLTYSLVEYPAGMTITPDTGVITWTPGCEDICDCGERDSEPNGDCTPIKVKVSDDCDSADKEFCIEVIPNLPPVITNLPNCPEEAKCGESGTFQVLVDDSDSTALTYEEVGTWPDWLLLNIDTGLISWDIPCPDTPDSYTVQVKVSDECSSDTEDFSIEVTCEPEEVGLDDFRVAFEDIPWDDWSGGDCQGINDFDYNDCVSDVNVVGEFICGNLLKEITFAVTYQYDGSGYLDHKFGLKMPDVFNSQPSYTAILDGNPAIEETLGEGDFIIFDKSVGAPNGPYVLTITFTTPFAYSYNGFTSTDIHGDLMDVKPFIDIYNGGSFVERLLAGMGTDEGNRVLLVPYTWQWPDEGDPIWDVYNEVSLVSCYPVFDSPFPGTWTPHP